MLTRPPGPTVLQHDLHIPVLTVGETLDFSWACSGGVSDFLTRKELQIQRWVVLGSRVQGSAQRGAAAEMGDAAAAWQGFAAVAWQAPAAASSIRTAPDVWQCPWDCTSHHKPNMYCCRMTQPFVNMCLQVQEPGCFPCCTG
jgi:hypothetical protein